MLSVDLRSQFLVVDATTAAPKEFTVEGTTFSPLGSIYSATGKDATDQCQSDPVQRLAEIASICNDAKVVYHPVSSISSSCDILTL